MKVAIVSPGRDAYSETFIRAHVDRLPAEVGEVVHLHGHRLPLWVDGGRPLPPRAVHLIGKTIAAAAGRPVSSVVHFLGEYLPGYIRERPLARYLNREEVDVILAEYGQTGVAMSPVARRADIPLVVHFHGWDAYMNSVLAEYDEGYRELFGIARGIVAVSSAMAAQLRRLGADPEQLHVCPCGVDLDRFEACDVAESDPTFLAVGRFVEKKAPHLTILAFSSICDTFPDASLVMAGEGHLLDACKSLVRGLDIEDRVSFRGAVSNQEVARLMGSSRAFVQHSLQAPNGDSEGNPVAVREAMASGLPVIATRHAGIAESVVHEETGFLVDEHDWRSMAGYMEQLLDDQSLAARLGRSGRERAEEQFGIERAVRTLGRVLKKAAAG